MLIDLFFSLDVTAETLGVNTDLKLAFFERGGSVLRSNFHVEGGHFCTDRQVSECADFTISGVHLVTGMC